MQKIATSIPDLFIIKPTLFRDARGYFMETYNQVRFGEIGLGDISFLQDNLSRSAKGTIRGLHYQLPPFAQGKLVTVFEGVVLDVAVDIRKGSPTYGKHEAILLDADDPVFFYVPPGFAHGFQVLSDSCLFYYKCTQTYHAPSDRGILWNDPALAIGWKSIPATLSAKDEKAVSFQDFDSPFQYGEY